MLENKSANAVRSHTLSLFPKKLELFPDTGFPKNCFGRDYD